MAQSEYIVDFLERCVGLPYQWGGKDGKPGYDCSGLVSAAFKWVNTKIPEGSYNQVNLGRKIPVRDAHAGCLVFKRRLRVGPVYHVGIVVRNKCVIEAHNKKWGVVKHSFVPSSWHEARKIDSIF